ncbi:RNA polymerase sigma factor [Dyadobacter sp. CY343]|uniref:RNA polymerase sigma factor n=1 Tax=Dyadobacter sp. CY343 TaxID=2907299 RepID=UPI001F17A8F3|nr:RNA polymerase sigma-70 factor [Dyadobacter sp. CY343]MCE7059313.1 RNA polymerase sigma-70 factor [Dyadobacter sp. CY343]
MNYIYDNCSDENILTLIREQHDELAFEALYNRYFKSLFNYAYSKVHDQFAAQEIIQELFVNLWQQRDRMYADCCKSLLFTIAKRQVISFYRKELTRRRHYDQWTIHQPGHEETADQSALVSDLELRYQSGLHLLPPKCQEVFILSRQGFANKNIAEQLSISEKTVEQHITKALRVLKAHLKEHMIYALILSLIF